MSKTDENNNKTTYEYDNVGQLGTITDALGNKTIYEYDGVGNRLSMTDALGNTTRYEYQKIGTATNKIHHPPTNFFLIAHLNQSIKYQ
ncbi:MAG: hypothetical protein AB1567_07360 [bacterium]